MNELLTELRTVDEMRSTTEKDIKREVQALRKEITRAARLATIAREEADAKSVKSVQAANTIDEILRDIRNLSSDAGRTPASSKSLQIIIRRLARMKDDTDLDAEPMPEEEGPPVVFTRVPRDEVLVVDSRVLEEGMGSGSPPSGLETFLDNMFSSSDSIYETTIRNLREQLIAAHNRNQALELNLDMAEKELEYWRNRGPTHPVPIKVSDDRLVKAQVWKHAVSKFIGSFDQFTMLKALFHWRHFVVSKSNSSS